MHERIYQFLDHGGNGSWFNADPGIGVFFSPAGLLFCDEGRGRLGAANEAVLGQLTQLP